MTTHYVATDGVASGPGTIGAPWTLDYARLAARVSGGDIAPGDTVYLRGGTYSDEGGFIFTLNGTAGNQITFAGYPGETVILDGAYAALATIGNSEWELYDAPTNTYRTVSTSYQVGAATDAYGFIPIGGVHYPLATHDPFACLTATTQHYRKLTDFYLGPGIAENSPDGRIYIRLEAVDQAAHHHTCATPDAGSNPADYELKLCVGTFFGIDVTGSYLTFEDIIVNDYYGLIRTTGTGVTFRRISGRFGMNGCKVGSSNGTTIDSCTLDGLMTPADWWVAWCDVKGGRTIADGVRKFGIGGDACYNLTVTGCTIANVFDGMLMSGVSPIIAHDIEVVGCTFTNIWDDMWQMFCNLYNIEIHHNRGTGAGPSHDATGANLANTAPGTVYMHHNVWDASAVQMEWGRVDTLAQGTSYEGMGAPNVLSSHSIPGVDKWSHPWKLYYNTYVLGNFGQADLGSGMTLNLFGNVTASFHGAEPHEVLNNIIVQPSPSRTLSRDVEMDTGREIYDGNVYGMTDDGTNSKFFSFVHTSTADMSTNATVGSLAKIRATQALADSQVYYAPGYENSGLQLDPLLDAAYRPQAASVQTGAVDITAKGWPGATVYEAWRGAVDPQVVVASAPGPPGSRRRALLV